MIRTALFAASLALALPAAAQEAPQPAGPFQIESIRPDMSGAVSLPSVRVENGVGKATLIFFLSPAMSQQMSGIGRMDMNYEFRCAQRVSRTVGVTAWAPSGALIEHVPDAISDWEAVNPTSPNEATRAFVCENGALEGPVVSTLAEFQALHQRQQ